MFSICSALWARVDMGRARPLHESGHPLGMPGICGGKLMVARDRSTSPFGISVLTMVCRVVAGICNEWWLTSNPTLFGGRSDPITGSLPVVSAAVMACCRACNLDKFSPLVRVVRISSSHGLSSEPCLPPSATCRFLAEGAAHWGVAHDFCRVHHS